MNASQMQMLSVKSAIERTVQGLIAAYSITDASPDKLYEELCRYMASLFASRQVDQDYKVRMLKHNVSVSFWYCGQHSTITFMLPFKLPKQEPLGEPFQKILDDHRWELYEPSEPTPSKTPADYVKKYIESNS